MARISVEDVFAHVVEQLRASSDTAESQTMEEFLAGCTFDLRVCITDDLEATELDYLERFGKGHTFYFRLADYEHGKILAGQIYWIMLGKRPDLTLHTGSQFSPDVQLYLFVHVRNPFPAALN